MNASMREERQVEWKARNADECSRVRPVSEDCRLVWMRDNEKRVGEGEERRNEGKRRGNERREKGREGKGRENASGLCVCLCAQRKGRVGWTDGQTDRRSPPGWMTSRPFVPFSFSLLNKQQTTTTTQTLSIPHSRCVLLILFRCFRRPPRVTQQQTSPIRTGWGE